VAQREQMLGGQAPAGAIVRGDRREPEALFRGVHEDDRQGSVGQPVAVPRAEAARRDHDPVDPAVDEQVEVAGLALRVVVGVAEQDRVAQLAGRVLDGPDELREERVLDIGDDQSDRPRRALAQRASHARGPVAQLPGGRVDALLRLRPRPAVAGQDAADGGGRDARAPRHVGDRRRHRRSPDRPRSVGADRRQILGLDRGERLVG
jgi:hypothetical protein